MSAARFPGKSFRRLGPVLVFGSVLCLLTLASAREAETYDLKGRVTDKVSRSPVPEVGVSLLETKFSAVTGENGDFMIKNVPAGSYQMMFDKDGYIPVLLKVSVSGEKNEIFVEAVLEALKKEVMVTAEAFSRAETVASSGQLLTGAQVRTLPGIFEDVSRAIQIVPGVASSGDFKNDLIVRGGSPAENLFMVDFIQVPGLSHFGSQNSSGGSVGLLNMSLIRDIEFYSGGYPAYYGDKLSSVTRISLREGRRSRISGNLDLSLFGVSGVLEGPLFSKRGSWIFSLRKDYFKSIPRDFTLNLTVVPDFADGQAKFVYDFSAGLQLSVIGLAAQDGLNIEETDDPPAERMRISIGDRQAVYGATLRALLGKKGVAYVTLSRMDNHYSYTLHSHGLERYTIRSGDEETTARFDMEYFLLPKFELLAGLSFKQVAADHHIYYRGGYIVIDRMGFRFTRKNTDASLSGDKRAFYLQASYPITKTLKTTVGIRGDYFRYIDDFSLSPRFGISYAFLPGGEMHFSYGIHFQSPETFWLDSHPANRDLRYLRSEHLVFGIGQSLGRDVRATVEIFAKKSRNYPVDSSNPYLTLANLGGSIVPTFFGSRLLGVGSGFARGLEVSLQKASTAGFSWLIDYSYSRVEYKALDGVMRPGDFDFRHILNAVASYRISATLQASMKWRYTGGQPYTPFDLQLSAQRDTSYFDMTKINTLRYPAYHRLDFRLEKKFVFKKWNLDAYIDVQNVYNRKNVYYTFWEDGRPKTVHYLPIIPLIGLGVHFPN